MSGTLKSIAEGVFYSSLGNTLIKGISIFCYAVVLARVPLHDYGVFVFLLSFLDPACAIIFFGFDRLFVSNLAHARGEGNISRIKGLLRDYYFSILILSLFTFILIFLSKGLWLHYYTTPYLLKYFWLICFFIGSQIVFNGIQLFLEASERFRTISFLQSLEAIIRCAMILIMINRLSIDYLLAIYSVAKFLAFLIGSIYFVKLLKPLLAAKTVAEKGVILKILKAYGKWEIFRNIIEKMSNGLKIWIIKFFVNVESVAVFDFAQNIYGAIMSFVPIKSIIFPVISRTISKRNVVNIIIAKAQKYSFFCYSIIYLASLIFLPALVGLIFPRYSGAMLVIYICLMHLFIEIYRMGQSALVYALNQQKFLFFIYPATFILEVVLYSAMSYFFGIIGYVFAWHISVLTIGVAMDIFLRKRFNIKSFNWRDFASFDSYDRLIVNKIFIVMRCRFRQLYSKVGVL